MVMTRDCFEPATAFLLFGSPDGGDAGLAAGTGAAGAVNGFFAGFDMEILRSVHAARWPHHRRPTSATKPAGQDLWTRLAPTIGASTAPFSPESQSFLDNVIAQFADVRAWNDRSNPQSTRLRIWGSEVRILRSGSQTLMGTSRVSICAAELIPLALFRRDRAEPSIGLYSNQPPILAQLNGDEK